MYWKLEEGVYFFPFLQHNQKDSQESHCEDITTKIVKNSTANVTERETSLDPEQTPEQNKSIIFTVGSYLFWKLG